MVNMFAAKFESTNFVFYRFERCEQHKKVTASVQVEPTSNEPERSTDNHTVAGPCRNSELYGSADSSTDIGYTVAAEYGLICSANELVMMLKISAILTVVFQFCTGSWIFSCVSWCDLSEVLFYGLTVKCDFF